MDEIMNAINSIAEKVPDPENGSYVGEDGLMYCSVCNQRKQCRVTFLGKERIMPCACKCDIEKWEQERKSREAIEFEDRVKTLRLMAFPNTNMQNWTFENDDGKCQTLSNAFRSFVENFESFRQSGTGLLLYGGVGTGKTFSAACIANALIDKGTPVLMTSFPRIANTVQGMTAGRQEYYDSFQEYALLILDDLAAERKTEYMQEIVYNVIDARCSSGLPMIVTSNLTAQEFKNPGDEISKRIFSRLLKCCHPIEFTGPDRRKQQLRNDFNDTKKLLGL